jgi:hypothetical protein
MVHQFPLQNHKQLYPVLSPNYPHWWRVQRSSTSAMFVSYYIPQKSTQTCWVALYTINITLYLHHTRIIYMVGLYIHPLIRRKILRRAAQWPPWKPQQHSACRVFRMSKWWRIEGAWTCLWVIWRLYMYIYIYIYVLYNIIYTYIYIIIYIYIVCYIALEYSGFWSW